jgi:hypothetical protein
VNAGSRASAAEDARDHGCDNEVVATHRARMTVDADLELDAPGRLVEFEIRDSGRYATGSDRHRGRADLARADGLLTSTRRGRHGRAAAAPTRTARRVKNPLAVASTENTSGTRRMSTAIDLSMLTRSARGRRCGSHEVEC